MITLALLRFLKRTPWSTFMALFGVALGVTSIVSVHLISASIAQRLDGQIPSQLAGYSHFMHRDGITAADYFELRGAWRSGTTQQITQLAPIIDEHVELHSHGVRVIGVDLFEAGVDLLPQASGQPTTNWSWSGVWVDESLADVLPLPVNGVIAAPPGTLLADISIAQELLGWSTEKISYVGARVDDPLVEVKDLGEKLLPGFAAGLPQTKMVLAELPDWQLLSLAQQHPASQFGKSVLFNISALGLLALLVAWFLIYQVAVSWLRRLWPVFERLHVLGVEWSHLRSYFVLMMCVLGGIAAMLGLVWGQWLAVQLYAAAAGLGELQFELDKWVVSKALVSALGVCLLGGLWAFRQSRQDDIVGAKPIALTLILLTIAAFGVFVPAAGLLGSFLSIAVLSMLTALLVTPLLRKARQFSPLFGGPYLVRLSLREAVWYPRDVGVALAGLTLAVATAIGVGLMVDSFRSDFDRMLQQRLSYDISAQGDALVLVEVQTFAEARNDVLRVQVYGDVLIRAQGVPVELTVSRLDSDEAARYSLQRTLGRHDVLLSEQGARMLSVDAGDQLVLEGAQYPVAGVFSSFGDLQPRLIVDREHPLAGLVTQINSVSLVATEPQSLVAELRRQFPSVKFDLQSEIRNSALATFDQTFAITTVLILIAMLVASIGVYLAVTAMRMNKQASSKLLVGMGINRWETVGMDLSLGIAMGLIAVLLAVPLGVTFGWILCTVINPRAFGWTVELQFSLLAFVQPIGWGLFAAAVAGLLRIGRYEDGVAHASG